jgi:hypothetical protein
LSALPGAGERVETASPSLGGLAMILDAGGDGDITDDVAKMGVGFLGKLFGGRKR